MVIPKLTDAFSETTKPRKLFSHAIHVDQLAHSNPKCQSLTYLGADNAISTDQAPFEGSTGSYESALAFMTAAATAADTTAPQRVGVLPPSPPSKVGRPGAEQPAPDGVEPVRGRDDLAAVTVSLRTLDQILLEEACTPAGAARALATVACRLHDLADELGGGIDVARFHAQTVSLSCGVIYPDEGVSSGFQT